MSFQLTGSHSGHVMARRFPPFFELLHICNLHSKMVSALD
jgi:hypothetical protein